LTTHFPVFSQRITANAGCLTLRNEITALRLCGPPKMKIDSAMFAELPKGAMLVICGAGFNHRTLKVRWQNDTYYVFERDLFPDDPLPE
jgi:hypothetical protein